MKEDDRIKMESRLIDSINLKLLKKIRIESGLSIENAAKNILNPKKLERVENNEEDITFNQFYNLAHRYKMPISFFYLNEEPKNEIFNEYRTVKSKKAKISPILRKIFYEIEEKRDLCIEFSSYDKEYDYSDVNKYNSKLIVPEELAKNIRNNFNFDIIKIKSFNSPYQSFNYWKKELTEKGILVFQFSSVDVKEVRGFSLSKTPYPVIAVNRKDAPQGRIFSLIHEYAHILIKSKRYHVFFDQNNRDIEAFCNAVAGNVLVNSKELFNHKIFKKHDNKVWNDEEIKSIASSFKVSKFVILRRLLDLNIIDHNFYQQKEAKWNSIAEKKKTGGFETQHDKTLRINPEIFIRVMLQAYFDNKITTNKLSNYFNLKLKHLDNLIKALEK